MNLVKLFLRDVVQTHELFDPVVNDGHVETVGRAEKVVVLVSKVNL